MKRQLKRLIFLTFAIISVIALISLPSFGGEVSARAAVGDINIDGHINGDDAKLLFDYLSGKVTFSARQKLVSDIDYDGNVTICDAVQLYRYVNGVIGELPVIKFSSIRIISLPYKTEYYEGDEFSMDGFEARTVYSDGSSLPFTDYSFSGYSSTPGTKIIVVTNGSVSVAFTVIVYEKTLSSIELIGLPVRRNYNIDEPLNLNGLSVVAYYTDGTSRPLKSGYTVSGYEAVAGQNTVTVGYGGFYKSFEVSVGTTTISYPAIVQSGGSRLNCRTGPGTEYPSAGLFNEGQDVTLLDLTDYNGWYYVSGISTQGTIISGYCYASYVIIQ